MGQLYPNPVSTTQGVTINTSTPLIGGGTVPLGGSITLGLNTTTGSTRSQYSVTPTPNGTVANFTIVGAPANLYVSYMDVYVDGVRQSTAVYSVSGNVVSFNTAPTSGQVIYTVFSNPVDSRQEFTLTPLPDGSNKTFSFPNALPQGSYVDVFVDGLIQSIGSDYYLNIVNGAYSIQFVTAPAIGTSLTTVFDPSTNAGRNQYALSPAANGTITDFSIQSGSPSTPYIDVYVNGLWKAETTDYTLSYSSGVWKVSFTSAPASGAKLCAVFAPVYVVPAAQSLPSIVNTLNGLTGNVTLVAGSNITITPSGNNLTIAASTGTSYLKGTVTINISGTTGRFYASTNIPGTPVGAACYMGLPDRDVVLGVGVLGIPYASTDSGTAGQVNCCIEVNGLSGAPGNVTFPVVVFP